MIVLSDRGREQTRSGDALFRPNVSRRFEQNCRKPSLSLESHLRLVDTLFPEGGLTRKAAK